MHKKTLEERFWAKVDKRGPRDCWLWRAAVDADGYGLFRVYNGTGKGAVRRAHIVSYELEHGAVADGMQVLHDPEWCHYKGCVNPRHLRAGTQTENMRDRFVAHGEYRNAKGVQHGCAKLSEEEIQEIRRLRPPNHGRRPPYLRDIAKRYGVHLATIAHICNGDRWRHL